MCGVGKEHEQCCWLHAGRAKKFMRRRRISIRPKSLGQKNYRNMPEHILGRVDGLSQDEFVVASVRKIPAAAITAGKYAHIGISMTDDAPVFPARQIPHPQIGRYCSWNARGVEIVLTHLPKVTRTYSVDTPNWGDWSNGYHTVEWDREVYRREFFPPKQLELGIELLGEEAVGEKLYVFKFTVIEVLNRKELPFKKSRSVKNALFFNVNLLQECVGAAGVFSSTATREDYLKSLYVDWEILPPGEREGTINRILSGVKAPTPELRKRIADRYDALVKLKPEAFITGASGLRRYFGAKFADDLVVFENLEYGNAIYAMFEEWETLSKKTRPQLLSGDRKGFERIVHKKGWEQKLKELVERRKLKPAA
jgi:hypothetical protein